MTDRLTFGEIVRVPKSTSRDRCDAGVKNSLRGPSDSIVVVPEDDGLTRWTRTDDYPAYLSVVPFQGGKLQRDIYLASGDEREMIRLAVKLRIPLAAMLKVLMRSTGASTWGNH